jgi:hypothetical protein
MREGTFVGREEELQQLNDSLRTALSGSGQTRFIIGEAGTGKTALFHHFVQRALEAELHRLRGTQLQRAGSPQDMEEAEASFERALEIARLQQARSLELRTVLCLGDLRRAQGDERGLEMARAMLAETYGWFTEGFETPDLKEARNRLAATES